MRRGAARQDVDWTGAFTDPRLLVFAARRSRSRPGLLTGLAPALQAGRADVAAALKAGVA